MSGAACIRLANAEDVSALVDIYAPYCTSSVISFEEVGPDAAEMSRRLDRVLPSHPWLVFEQDGLIAGYAYAAPHRERAAYRWAVDVTVYLRPSYHRKGIGKALYTTLFAILVEQGYHRAYAGVTLPNPASEGLHEAMGFRPVGVYERVGYKFGTWHDVRWYQRDLRSITDAPGPISTMAEVYGTPAWIEAIQRGATGFRSRI